MARILMLTHEFHPLPAGIARYTSELALAASQLGHEVTVVAPDYGRRELRNADHQYPYTVQRFPGAIYRAIDLLPLLIRTARITKLKKWDVVHAVDWPFALALRILNRFRACPFVATIYGTELLSLKGSRQTAWLGANDMFEFPERYFAISEFTRSLLVKYVPTVNPDRIVITPLGVAQYWFERVSDDRIAQVRNRLGIPTANRVILTAARLDPRKGQDRVIAAIERLKVECKSSLTYVIVGSSSDATYVEKLRRQASGCGAQVIFAGVVSDDDLRALYATSSLFCMPGELHPQKVEGFGLAYLEAAAQGCPCVACSISAVPEVVLDGKTGILIQPQDINALANAIRDILHGPQLRNSLGEAARAWASQFTWERCARLTYGPLMKDGHARAQTGTSTAASGE